MKAKEIHSMNEQELTEEEDRLRRRLFDLKAQSVTEKLENPRELGGIRRDIARILTISRQRQLKQDQGAQGE